MFRTRREKYTKYDKNKTMYWCTIYYLGGKLQHEGQFLLISMLSPIFSLCSSIYIYLCIKARLKFIKVLDHVCVGFMDPNFKRGIALWSHWARKWWGSLKEREGWQMLWCAEIDNIKGSLTKTHFLATTQASSCVTAWCNNLDECEADGCRLSLSQNDLGYDFGKCKPYVYEDNNNLAANIFENS